MILGLECLNCPPPGMMGLREEEKKLGTVGGVLIGALILVGFLVTAASFGGKKKK